MGDPGPYTERERRFMINAAAVLGWIVVTADSFRALGPEAVLLFLPFAAIIGLPVAFLACWLIGAPILARMTRRSVSYPRAALCGGLIAGLISVASIMIGRILGWMESLDDSRSSQFGGGDFVQSVDGILTPYGWLVVAQSTAIFVGIGALIGLVVRAFVGPGTAQSSGPSHSKADGP
jgi:hypothetical protein